MQRSRAIGSEDSFFALNLNERKTVTAESTSLSDTEIDLTQFRRLQKVEGNYTSLDIETRTQLEQLGNVYMPNDRYYFTPSCDSNKCAKTFLHLVVHDKKVIDLINARLKTKQSNLGIDKVWPNCISFVTTKLNDEYICYVAVSGTVDEGKTATELFIALSQIANKLNKIKAARMDKYRFEVAQEGSEAFKEMLSALTDNTRRSCTEFYYGYTLANRYLENGNQFVVEGVTNLALFPYEKTQTTTTTKHMGGRNVTQVALYTMDYAFVNKFWSSASKLVVKSIGKNYEFIAMPCCEVCQKNKAAFFAAFLHFQNQGENLVETQRVIKEKSDSLKISAPEKNSEDESSCEKEKPKVKKSMPTPSALTASKNNDRDEGKNKFDRPQKRTTKRRSYLFTPSGFNNILLESEISSSSEVEETSTLRKRHHLDQPLLKKIKQQKRMERQKKKKTKPTSPPPPSLWSQVVDCFSCCPTSTTTPEPTNQKIKKR